MPASEPKVFGIGSGKTGTTSLGAALQSLGFRLGDQARGELLLSAWARRDFRPVIDYCHSAQAFQDVPFCLDDTYAALDRAFPGSKFILTVRDSAEEWYQSLVRFHTKIVGKKRLPTADDMKAFAYRYTGWIWDAHQAIYGIDEATLFDPIIYKANYYGHIAEVLDYFQDRDDLLVLKVSEPDAMGRLCEFLGVDGRKLQMPHLNSSRQAA